MNSNDWELYRYIHYGITPISGLPYSPTGYGLSVFHKVTCPKCGYIATDVMEGMSKCNACGYDLMRGDRA